MRFAAVSAAALLVLASAAPALAQNFSTQNQAQLPPAPRASQQVAQPRAVMVCDADAATRVAFTREYGTAPVFITARQAVDVRRTSETWSTPRCMTAREHDRYVNLTRSIAAR